jgi:hypothetical protein
MNRLLQIQQIQKAILTVKGRIGDKAECVHFKDRSNPLHIYSGNHFGQDEVTSRHTGPGAVCFTIKVRLNKANCNLPHLCVNRTRVASRQICSRVFFFGQVRPVAFWPRRWELLVALWALL